GRWTATEILTGLPVIFVTTIGAKSGLARTNPLLAIRDGENYILIATNFGSERHPHWYFNMKTNPQVEVAYPGHQASYRASELDGVARQVAWDRAIRHYPGYVAYSQRAHQRRIPVLQLTPQSPDFNPSG
ncbi:MAG: nitroreductase family deazaflavin-dependent oxidoreductase, partial [Anaerolineales bacterium]